MDKKASTAGPTSPRRQKRSNPSTLETPDFFQWLNSPRADKPPMIELVLPHFMILRIPLDAAS
jgi:hypothetical protein